MVAIFNENTANPIPITECLYDYMEHTCHLKNHIPSQWTPAVLNYLSTLVDTPINSIMIKHNNQIIRHYLEVHGMIINVQEVLRVFELAQQPALAELWIDIQFEEDLREEGE